MNGLSVDVTFDASRASRMLADVERNIEPAAVTAINKTLTSAQSNIRRGLARAFRVRVKDVRFRITLPRRYKARRGKMSGNVAAWFSPLKASKFGSPRQTKTGATVRGPVGGRRKFPGAFVATMPSGHRGVYRRKSKRRLPIDEVTVPLMPQAGRIAMSQWRRVTAKMPGLYIHEIRRRARLL